MDNDFLDADIKDFAHEEERSTLIEDPNKFFDRQKRPEQSQSSEKQTKLKNKSKMYTKPLNKASNLGN